MKNKKILGGSLSTIFILLLGSIYANLDLQPHGNNSANNDASQTSIVNESEKQAEISNRTAKVEAEVSTTGFVAYDESYGSPEKVAAYLNIYEELPPNYITKDEAEALGWVSSEGNLWEVTDQMSIGGDYFGNYEGQLPEDDKYREADVNYQGGYRKAERIVYSDDGDIYYTPDHYQSFDQLYEGD